LIAFAVAFSIALAAGADRSEGDDPAAAARFGDWLFERGDYYRAIGEYERAMFLGADASSAERLTLRMGQAYGRGGQLEKATELLRLLSERAEDRSVRDAAAFEIGYARLVARRWDLAAMALHRYSELEAPAGGPGPSRARLLEGIALLHAGGQDQRAAEVFDLASRDLAVREVARDLGAEALSLRRAPSKSPVVAGALSAVVPGLGHLYVEEPAMAAAAFLLNGVFIWATVESFHGRRPGAGIVFLVGESLWYGGAVFGAVADALRYGREARVERLEALDSRYRWLSELREAPGRPSTQAADR
jgi:hypothetical protein